MCSACIQLEAPQDLFSPRQLEFLDEGMVLSLQIIEGDVIWANMPEFVTMKVTDTTAKGVSDSTLSVKSATLSNGATIKVPLYIETGQMVKVSTEEGHFVEKA